MTLLIVGANGMLARALKQAGAATIDVWCVARATLDS